MHKSHTWHSGARTNPPGTPHDELRSMMDDHEDAADVFAIPDLWKSSKLLDQSVLAIGDGSPFFSLQIADKSKQPLKRGDHHDLEKDGFFKLPPMLEDLKVEGPVPQPFAELRSDDSVDARFLPVDYDPWLCHDFAAAKIPQFLTWESFARPEEFESPGGRSPPASFITEAGPAAFDALSSSLFKTHPADDDGVIGTAIYCTCLLALAMGRSSILFSWDGDKKSFVKNTAGIRPSGLSVEVLSGIVQTCLECANSTRVLRAFVDKTYTVSPTPSKVALADVVDKLLRAVQSELGSRAQKVRSLLQLQAAVKPVHSSLVYFRDLVTRLRAARSDEEILSLLFRETQAAEYGDNLARNAICEVLRMVSKPWTDFVEEWIGIREEQGIVVAKDGPGKGFVKVGNKVWIDDQGFELEEPDFFLDEERMPSFVPQEMATAIFETGRNFRFIREHHPEHVLSEPNLIATTNPPKLQWEFDWDAIKQLEARAKEYETSLSRAIQEAAVRKATEGGPVESNAHTQAFELQIFGKDEADIAEAVLASMAKLDQPLATTGAGDHLARTIREQIFDSSAASATSDEGFTPHWSLLPLLSFSPVVTAQARMVNRECVKLLFSCHELRAHLDLQKQYHLLGNGLFTSRLSHALFDPELDTAERQAGVALTGSNMGLRLTGRDNWPPASSELRLALMGVLSDSYQPPSHEERGKASPLASRYSSSDLPGDLSFAVRELSPEEMERCIDPDGLEALDFLRLSYKPPAALRPILTPLILLKYDRIFQLLLRTLRMLYTTNQLFRDVSMLPPTDSPVSDNAILRFRLESQHFISQVAAYFFTTGVNGPWQVFETTLDRTEGDVLRPQGAETDAAETRVYSPDRLREHQEQTLDDIMLALLLRKRQAPVLKLLEDIFGIVLRFAKVVRMRVLGRYVETEGSRPEELYPKLRKKIELFVTVCRGMNENLGLGPRGKRRDEEGRASRSTTGMEQLLLRLDSSGYYTKKPST
ncbi:hypothetical protein GQ53DRAFT_722749 [Thozetella sp. PMI_491]|nr:hypothetical protein GQ53DRAFT_722749 [Thozetella sp. PMI_491]